jgi:hypothetical protein
MKTTSRFSYASAPDPSLSLRKAFRIGFLLRDHPEQDSMIPWRRALVDEIIRKMVIVRRRVLIMMWRGAAVWHANERRNEEGDTSTEVQAQLSELEWAAPT